MGDYICDWWMPLPVGDSWLVLVAALTPVVVGRHQEDAVPVNKLWLLPILTALFRVPIVKPAHAPALNCLSEEVSFCLPSLWPKHTNWGPRAERFLEKVLCHCLQVLEAFAWLMHLQISPCFLQSLSVVWTDVRLWFMSPKSTHLPKDEHLAYIFSL